MPHSAAIVRSIHYHHTFVTRYRGQGWRAHHLRACRRKK